MALTIKRNPLLHDLKDGRMRATRIATSCDHKQEASFPQVIFLFPEMDKNVRRPKDTGLKSTNVTDFARLKTIVVTLFQTTAVRKALEFPGEIPAAAKIRYSAHYLFSNNQFWGCKFNACSLQKTIHENDDTRSPGW
jgi:hypothetical protein